MTRWALTSALVLIAIVGCQKQSAIPDGPVAQEPTASAPIHSSTASPTSPAAPPVAPTPPVSPAPDPEIAALAAYNKKFAPIIREWSKATQTHGQEMNAAKPKFEKEGPVVLLPVYEHYASATDRADQALKGLTPPKSAKAVHDAWVDLLTKLGENLDQTVAGLNSEEGADDVMKLLSDRKQIRDGGFKRIADAMLAGGFDTKVFDHTGRLVKIAPK